MTTADRLRGHSSSHPHQRNSASCAPPYCSHRAPVSRSRGMRAVLVLVIAAACTTTHPADTGTWTTPVACPSGACASATTCALPTTGYVHLTAGFRHTCGLRGNGTIACWGDDSRGQSEAPAGSFTKLDAGDFHTCALAANGALTC